jgi:ABC-type multidrug transport system ATPase subunit
MLFTTHDLDEAEKLADHILILAGTGHAADWMMLASSPKSRHEAGPRPGRVTQVAATNGPDNDRCLATTPGTEGGPDGNDTGRADHVAVAGR